MSSKVGNYMKNVLSIENISREFETKDSSILALENVNLNVKKGEILAIIGPSGCGKSTLLNIIAGLDKPTSGRVLFASEKPVVSYMLQSDALLPWRSVLDNATLGLEIANRKDEKSIEMVRKMLIDYGLEEFIDKKPPSLSGGMKQRVALARCLAVDPEIILLDEPFSALDYFTRLNIAQYVHDMIKKSGKTAIIITHDIQEAISIGDRVVVFSQRPSHAKNIYEVNLEGDSLIEKRSKPEFNQLFKEIWGDLDDEL